jgi:hypothetical protein
VRVLGPKLASRYVVWAPGSARIIAGLTSAVQRIRRCRTTCSAAQILSSAPPHLGVEAVRASLVSPWDSNLRGLCTHRPGEHAARTRWPRRRNERPGAEHGLSTGEPVAENPHSQRQSPTTVPRVRTPIAHTAVLAAQVSPRSPASSSAAATTAGGFGSLSHEATGFSAPGKPGEGRSSLGRTLLPQRGGRHVTGR